MSWGCAPLSTRPGRSVEPASASSPHPRRAGGAGDRGGGAGRDPRRRAEQTAVRPALGPAGSFLAAAPPAPPPPHLSSPPQNEETEELAPSCAAGPALGVRSRHAGALLGAGAGRGPETPPEQVSAATGLGVATAGAVEGNQRAPWGLRRSREGPVCARVCTSEARAGYAAEVGVVRGDQERDGEYFSGWRCARLRAPECISASTWRHVRLWPRCVCAALCVALRGWVAQRLAPRGSSVGLCMCVGGVGRYTRFQMSQHLCMCTHM